ncbi:MAG: sugar phosphate isomerase/epimerase [Armatimonadetes bacterium]|nr:TIM barrel protein [Armatimonadota bacterium]MBS1704076.1 sugar phosphate isomerase/epimerase [Armatimonadota bacterium]
MVLSAILVASTLSASRPVPFLMGVQAWTFHNFSAFEAIEKTAQAGAKYIEFYPGQSFKPGSKSSMGPGLTAEEMADLKAQLNKFGVTPTAYGVTGIDKDYDKAKPLFVWAKSLGLKVLNTESVESIDTIEKLVKEFDIKVGFHNHPKRADNPSYKMWDPNYVYGIVKNRDHRIGSCADTGHWVRSGIKPIDALNMLHGRIVSSHLKDLNEFSPDAHDMPYGTGVSDVPAILAFYDKIGLKGTVSVEYEYNWDTNVDEVAQCIGYVRGLYGR